MRGKDYNDFRNSILLAFYLHNICAVYGSIFISQKEEEEEKKKDKFLILQFLLIAWSWFFKICQPVFYYINCKIMMNTLLSMATYPDWINSRLCSFVRWAYILQLCSFQFNYIISIIILSTDTLLPFCSCC